MSEKYAIRSSQYHHNFYLPNQSSTDNIGYYEPTSLDELEQKGHLYIIADPVSGTSAGSLACQYAIRKILHGYYRTATESDVEKRLIEVIKITNTQIFERNQQFPNRRDIATSLMVALIHQNKLIVANVGDSQAYVVWEQSIENLSENTSDKSSLNTTALGLTEEIEVEILYRRLFPKDNVVLCSGGVRGYIDEKQIADIVAQYPPHEAARRVTQLAYNRGCRDSLAVSVSQILEQSINQVPPPRLTLPEAPTWDKLLNQPLPKQTSTKTAIPNTVTVPPAPASKQRLWWGGLVVMIVALLCLATGFWMGWQYIMPPQSDIAETSSETEADHSSELSNETSDETSEASEPNQTPTLSIDETTTASEVTMTPESTSVAVADLSTPTPANETSLDELADTLPSPTSADLTPSTITPSPTPTVQLPEGCTSGARFFDDVTIPDGTEIVAGQTFEKAWSIQNNGTCPWVWGYSVRFMDGDTIHSTDQFQAPLTDPDEVTVVTASLVAPNQAGTHRSQWQMYDLEGEPFGADLYVEINVVAPEPGVIVGNPNETTIYNFIEQAADADWQSDDIIYTPQAGRIDSDLVVTSPLGIVVSGIAELRGRRDTIADVLLTHPHQETGIIEGRYAVDTPLQPTDELVVSLGFPQAALLNKDGAIFEIVFIAKDGSMIPLLSEQATYRGGIVSQKVSLEDVTSGQTGEFILRVLAGDNNAYDWALWLDARLVRSQ
ncbi:NBR1-Ig-like domain-containing protein [Anaerolineales bacterium HSG25]|nr:NBR1-Ig-like domain-containing protein [Anaerolineales bacterium HSG25]